MANGERRTANGERRTANGERNVWEWAPLVLTMLAACGGEAELEPLGKAKQAFHHYKTNKLVSDNLAVASRNSSLAMSINGASVNGGRPTTVFAYEEHSPPRLRCRLTATEGNAFETCVGTAPFAQPQGILSSETMYDREPTVLAFNQSPTLNNHYVIVANMSRKNVGAVISTNGGFVFGGPVAFLPPLQPSEDRAIRWVTAGLEAGSGTDEFRVLWDDEWPGEPKLALERVNSSSLFEAIIPPVTLTNVLAGCLKSRRLATGTHMAAISPPPTPLTA